MHPHLYFLCDNFFFPLSYSNSYLDSMSKLMEFIYVGEKYELAKKLPKIKLVNHRWLEDWYVLITSIDKVASFS